MSNNQSKSVPRSWHHRIARLIPDGYSPKCNAPRCEPLALYICEWDQMRGPKAVSGRKLYCKVHAANFARRHKISMFDLPGVKLSQLETASRDDWRYGEDIQPRMNTNQHEREGSWKKAGRPTSSSTKR